MSVNNTVSSQEAFDSADWWDEDGVHRLLHAVNPKRIDYLVKRCGNLAGKKVIDVGCGGGIFTLAIAETGVDVTGIDTSKHAIEQAKDQAKQKALPANFICTDSSSYLANSDNEKFDVVVCLEMLEHVDDPSAEIKALAELAKPGGDLILSTINRTFVAKSAMIWGLENLLTVLPKNTHQYEKFITPDELAQMCKQAGLSVVDIAGLNWNFFGKTFLISQTHMPVNYFLHART